MRGPRSAQGFTLIELMIGLAVLAILMTLAMPTFSAMLQNLKIRSTAESILEGLQTARAEALKRNQTVEFILTNDSPVEDNVTTYAADVAGMNWAIREHTGTAYTFIEGRLGAEGSNSAESSVEITSGSSTIAFNSLGGISAGAPADINIKNPIGGACKTAVDDAPMRCLKITLTATGQIRMCDPAVDDAGDTRKCP